MRLVSSHIMLVIMPHSAPNKIKVLFLSILLAQTEWDLRPNFLALNPTK